MTHDPSRRDVLAGVTSSIAVAVTPAWAWAASDAGATRTATVTIPVEGGAMPAYVARPHADGPAPLILVVHEIFGVHAWIQDICRRFAAEGYVAVAPYLYSRQGDVTTMPTIEDIFGKVVSQVEQRTVLADLDAARAWAAEHAEADLARVSVTGFCWGGTIVWLYAAHRADLRAGVAWYGKLATPPTALQPRRPIDVAAELRAPVLGLYGGQDASIPQHDVDAMNAALAAGSSGGHIEVFPDAGHGFLADYRPSYHAASATAAWGRALEWLTRHGAR
jgi:carboxymethylenebutenolidase